jgi:hypothetical protein
MEPPVTQVFTASEWARWMGSLGRRADAAGQHGLVVASMRVRPVLDKATSHAIPASDNGTDGAVNVGTYRRSWQTEVTPGRLAVFNRSSYAGIIEYGRRPGSRMPPREAVARWAQRKLGLSEADARAAAFVMARAIAKRGLRARRVLGGAEAEMGVIVRDEITKALSAALEAKR